MPSATMKVMRHSSKYLLPGLQDANDSRFVLTTDITVKIILLHSVCCFPCVWECTGNVVGL